MTNLIVHDGITDSIAGWARRIGLSKQALHRRLKAGWSIERALTPGIVRPAKKLTHAGSTLTIAEWANFTGIALRTIYHRLSIGWPLEHVLAVPTRGGHP